MMTNEFTGKTVLVTGSVRNTGLEIARRFLELGAVVYINGRTKKKVQYALDKLMPAIRHGSGEAREAIGDVSLLTEVQKMFAKISSEAKSLDILVNNAVVQGMGGPIHQVETEVFEQVVQTNLSGYFYCTREAAKMMVPCKSGCIVNLSSNTSQRAIRNRSVYVMTKGAIDAFTRAVALDLGDYNIRVNTIAPGYINTDRWETLAPELASQRRENIPIGFEATGRDVAEAVLFMASNRARNIHGARLVVDGGCSIQNMPSSVDV